MPATPLPEMTLPNPVPGVGVSPPIGVRPELDVDAAVGGSGEGDGPGDVSADEVALDHAAARVIQADVGTVDGAEAVAGDHVAAARLTHDGVGRVVDVDAKPADVVRR